MKLEKIIYSRGKKTFALTAREISVAALIAADVPRKEIASRLSISAATVKFHLRNVLKKTEAESPAAAVCKIIVGHTYPKG